MSKFCFDPAQQDFHCPLILMGKSSIGSEGRGITQRMTDSLALGSEGI